MQIYFRLALCALVVAAPSSSAAQNPPPHFDVDWTRPSMSGGFFETNVAEIGHHLAGTGSFYLIGGRKLLESRLGGDDVPLGDVVDRRLTAFATAGLSLFNRAELQVAVPYILDQTGLNTDLIQLAAGQENASGGFVGDLALDLRLGVLRQVAGFPLGLAIRGATKFPTGKTRRFGGEPAQTYELAVIASKTWGNHVAATEIGYTFRNEPMNVINIEVNDELLYRLAYRVRLGPDPRPLPVSFITELSGRTRAEHPFGANGGTFERQTSMEARGGLRVRSSNSWGLIDVDFGAGFGLTPGYGGAIPRVIIGARYATSDPSADDDHDGFVNANDECIKEPEDFDGFEDDDGCPDLDNDGDEIPDEDDECPLEPEDLDDVDDLDGCPDPVIPDSDGDGLTDDVDQCIHAPEDFDNFQDEDGCPDEDNDGDGLPDINDLCINEAEDFDGDADDDGCPDSPERNAPLVELRRDRIKLRRQIGFFPRKAFLTPGGRAVIEEAAVLLKKRSTEQIVIRVHPAFPNKKARDMAILRAEKVLEEFELLGIDRSRMSAEAGAWKRNLRGSTVILLRRPERGRTSP